VGIESFLSYMDDIRISFTEAVPVAPISGGVGCYKFSADPILLSGFKLVTIGMVDPLAL
jgi:hypothetical protein